MPLVEDNSVLLQARWHCTSGVGVCGRMCSGQYTLLYQVYLQYMLLCMTGYCARSCVLYMQSFIGCEYGWCGGI